MRPFTCALLIGIAALLVAPQPAEAQGRFTGKLVGELMKDGRSIKLVQPFGYIDARGRRWDVPAGAKTDGASVPRVFWQLFAPFSGKYREAAVIHDHFCGTKTRSWQDTHNVFYEAMLTAGVAETSARVMWAAVYNFADRWGPGVVRRAAPATEEEERQFVGELEAWVARANPSREEIAKAIDAGDIPR